MTPAGISKLLDDLEASTKALRAAIEQRASSDEYSNLTAEKLGLPFHTDPVLASAAARLRVVCERTARTVTPPNHVMFEAAGSFYTTVALQTAMKSEIAVLIEKESVTKEGGVPVDTLAKHTAFDADVLGRILRYLSARGIFQEVKPGCFSNTAASLTLVDNPEFVAHLDLVMHEGQLAASFLPELMKQRFQANENASPSPASAFQLYAKGQPWFSWLAANSDRGKNFHVAMRGTSITEGLAFLPVDYPFHSIPSETLIVDVGGSIGQLPELLLPIIPHLRFEVQDLEQAITQATESPSPNMKKWVEQGSVKFKVHDCFIPQSPEIKAPVFILKNVLHNHPNPAALKILQALRPSNPVKLLVIDRLLVPELRTEPYQGLHTSDPTNERPVSSQRIPTMYDLIMGCLPGGRTRSLDEWQGLLSSGGFKLVKVYPLRASMGQAVMEFHCI